jgi:hypothetical protein
MSALKESLQRIETWIEQDNSRLAQELRSKLRPGLTMQNLEERLSDLPILPETADSSIMKLSEEVYELYQWHNGEVDFAEMVQFLSLETSIALRSPYGPAGFFPIFGGEYYFCGVTGSQHQESKSPVLYYCFETRGHNTSMVSPSLTNLMMAVAECLESFGGISACTMALDSQADIPNEEFFSNYFNLITQENTEKLAPIYQKYQVNFSNIFP